MLPRALLVLALCSPMLVAVARADDHISVPGSSLKYPPNVTQDVGGGKMVKMRITGVALRKRLGFSVYVVGSYLDENAKAGSAEELIAVEAPKELILTMERDVDGKDLADAFTTAIRKNYPGDAFAAEIEKLMGLLGSNQAKKGDRVLLLSVPNVGLYALHIGHKDVFIANPAFAKAIWEIFLGKHPVTEEVKRGLVSRL
jgi:hypothetical protein